MPDSVGGEEARVADVRKLKLIRRCWGSATLGLVPGNAYSMCPIGPIGLCVTNERRPDGPCILMERG